MPGGHIIFSTQKPLQRLLKGLQVDQVIAVKVNVSLIELRSDILRRVVTYVLRLRRRVVR
jgi:hypothetical protein